MLTVRKNYYQKLSKLYSSFNQIKFYRTFQIHKTSETFWVHFSFNLKNYSSFFLLCFRASNQFQRSFRGSQTSLQQQPQGRPSNETLSPYMRDRPSSAYMQKENFPPSTMVNLLNFYITCFFLFYLFKWNICAIEPFRPFALADLKDVPRNTRPLFKSKKCQFYE